MVPLGSHAAVLRGVAAGGITDPTDITGLILWFDAEDSSTITLNGSDVSQWADKSVSGVDISMATEAQQPTVITAGQNGLDYVQYNVNDRLTNVSMTLAFSAFTLFVAGSLSSDSGEIVSMGIDIAGWVTADGFQFSQVAGTPDTFRLRRKFGDMDFTGDFGDGWRIAEAQYGSTAAEMFDNGSSIGTDTYADETEINPTKIGIGCEINEANPLTFDVGEIVMYDTKLSSDDAASVRTYLTNRWGL